MQLPIRTKGPKFQEDGGVFYVTKAGYAKMERQLADAKREAPVVAEEKSRAAALGDRSENAEYKDAKAHLSRLNSRILNIEDRLKRAVIIEDDAENNNLISIGSTVKVETNGIQKTYEIVGAFETDPSKGRISNTSPLGIALLGHKTGEEVTMKTPSGEIKYKIIEMN